MVSEENERHLLLIQGIVRWQWLYTALLVPVSLAPWALGLVGWVYGAVALAFGAGFLALAVAIWFDATDRAARRLFGYSILYLFVLFATMLAEGVLAPAAA